MKNQNLEKKLQNESGFTLLETVLASVVAVVVATLLMTILVNNNGLFYKQNAMVSEGLSLNDAVTKINQNIKQSISVAINYPETSPVYITGTETLVLKLSGLNGGDILNNVYDYLVISKDPTKQNVLRLQIFPDQESTRESANLVLTTILSAIQFSYLDKSGNTVNPVSATSIGLNLTVLSKTGSIGSNRSSTTITSLRNN